MGRRGGVVEEGPGEAEIVAVRREQRTCARVGLYLDPSTQLPSRATVVYCPRTHAAFGHSRYPLAEFLAAGTRVALGTDSLASNPDLDLFAEVRAVRRFHPEIPGAEILKMATLAGAEALGWQDETGSLAPGKSADLAVVPVSATDAADAHDLVLAGAESVSAVMCRGKWQRSNSMPQQSNER